MQDAAARERAADAPRLPPWIPPWIPLWIPKRSARHWALLAALALVLAGFIAQRAAHIATLATLNPTLFTAHHSTETYRAIDTPFKPRLFSYLAARPLLDPLPAETPRAPGEKRFEYAGGYLSVEGFSRTVARWCFLWMLITLAAASLTGRPLLWMFAICAGVAFAYSVQTMVLPYDLAALGFATWTVAAAMKGRFRWLWPLVIVGTGFKETLAVFATLAWAAPGPWRRRAASFAILCAVCLALLLSIDAYSGRAPLGMQSEHIDGAAKIGTNLQTIFELGPRLLLANAGFGLLIFLLPATGRLERTLQLTAALFLAGLLLFAAIHEWRIWFELLPLNLAVLTRVLDRHGAALAARAAAWRTRFATSPLALRGSILLFALVGFYLVAGLALRFWYHELSLYRLSRPAEIQQSFYPEVPASLYEIHPKRQITLRAELTGRRPGGEGFRMHTDARGLAFLPPNEGRFDLLVLGNSVAFGAGLPYERSFPGLLSLATDARVFSGATPRYGLEQSVELYEELVGEHGDPWQSVLYLWTLKDFAREVFREAPRGRRVAGAPPDLLRPRELFHRLTDRLHSPPEALTPGQIAAWNPRRYRSHLRMLRRLDRDGRLIVVLTYARPQLVAQDRRPQRLLIEGLEREGIAFIDTWSSYQLASFIDEPEQMHLGEQGSLAFAREVIEQLAGRRELR